ncbi:polysaccharide biosynthesis C-terminal domain-containing protein [Maridesulfovibrio hydrothermalis]|uniref:Polysaccharide biosynthesis protein n=1 Tax=Maridesulfovibrio hydrothermalis AM13 = DSM 14728 TaxID=1121451 RepID=L0RDK0_9BACT|nr:polysaccharide biosynthesis C-terminal domain-containing protein [Maridesulfovibrio hydrothermalis]CCO24824.1 Polysaccharide biosynthesis protein [Maridesulfovibrio hydrothermalis AM13 = DSM 14728]
MSSSLSNLSKIMLVFTVKAGKGVGGLFLTYVLAKKYGAFGSGLFFITYTFAFLCAQISQLGLGSACLKFAPVLKNDDPANISFLWTVTQLIVGVFALSMMGIVIAVPHFFSDLIFKNPDYSQYIICAAPIILFWSLTYLIVLFRQSLGDVSGITVIENSLIPWGMVLIAGSTFIIDFSVLQYVKCISALFGVSFIYAFISTRKKYSLSFTLKLNSSLTVRNILAYSLPLLVIAFAQNSLVWINTLILGGIGSVADSAVFVSTMKVGVSIGILLYTFNSVYVPNISAAYARRDFQAISTLYSDITCSLSFFSFIFMFIALLYSDMIMAAFGTDYNDGTGCLLFLILGNVFSCYIGPVGYVLIMSGRSVLDAVNTVAAFILNAVLCLVFYKLWGVTGAGFAFFGSNVVLNLMRYFQCRRILGIKWINRVQLRIIAMQLAFIGGYFIVRQFSFNRELVAVGFLVLYALVNINNIKLLLDKMKVRHAL